MIIKNKKPFKTILEGYRGSLTYGTYEPTVSKDIDIFGIFIPPKEYTIGLYSWEKYEKQEDGYDWLFYNLKKYISLALSGNFNVLEFLWLKPEFYTQKTALGEKLINNRDIFLSKQIYHCFIGYANTTIKEMLPYKYKGYMSKERKQIVDKIGYDCKNAYHCIRILRMGIECLKEGRLNVWREDRQQLLSIKKGEWSLEQVKREVEKLFKLAEEVFSKTFLPNEPDFLKANKLLIELTEEFWKEMK